MTTRVYLFRLQILIIDGSLFVLRKLLDQTLNAKGVTFDGCLKNERSTITRLRNRSIITQAQYDILFPSGGKVTTTLDLDITLTIFLLRSLRCFGLDRNFDWNVTPNSTDFSSEADIWRLKSYRNYIAHIPSTTTVQETDFNTWWNDIEQILVRLIPSQALTIRQAIADFKTCPLDAEEEERIRKEIEKWENCEAKVDRLQEEVKILQGDVHEVKKNVTRVREDVTDVKEDVTRVKEDVTGMREDVTVVKADVTGIKKDVTGVKADVTGVQEDVAEMKVDVTGVKKNVTEIMKDLDQLKRRQHTADDLSDNGASEEKEEECHEHKNIIDKTVGRLKDWMIPDLIIDADDENLTLFGYRDKRDIKEQKTTTEKNDLILRKVRSKDKNGYIVFKELLKRTQEKLVVFLTCTENGQDTKEIEKDLNKLAEERLNLSPRYFEHRKELKKQLVKFYKSKRSTVPLSPLVEEKVTPLAGFYVMPNMVMVKQTSHTSHQEERTPINSLTDLFITGSEDQQEIYLSADAGFGKTSFSKYLAITWSQACFPDNNEKCFKPEELKTLANFEFVFLVLLRDSAAACYIDEMIEQQLLKKIPPSSSQCPLHEVLEREKCLIILDGLDEWTHPDNGCSDKQEKVPHRYSRDNCVILTTTRPWKLGVSNLTTSDINKKVELVQLSKDSTRQLEKNAIRKMSGVNDDFELRRKTQEFDKEIASRGLQHMQTIPLLLMYITCLWCNKIPIGSSKVEVYINIIEFLLSRTAQKHPEVLTSSDPSHSDIPEFFKKHKFCEKFYSLLTALAELAYHALFNEEKENTLVFDGSIAEKYLEADDMKLSLLSGILTGSTTTTLIERKSKISFSHKTVQEFFAAIFISSQSDAQKTVVEKCKNVQSILDMSTICEFVSKMNSKIVCEMIRNVLSIKEYKNVQTILQMSPLFKSVSKENSKMMCEISTGLMSVINEDEKTRKYRTRTDYVFMYEEPLYNIQEMLVSCLQEMTGSENIKLCLQDFFIDGDTFHDEHLQRLLKLNTTNMKSLYYFGVHDEDLSLFLSPSLQTLRVFMATSRNYDGNLCEKLDSLKSVQYLDISDLTLSHEMLEIFYNFICGTKTIKQLKLFELSCIEHRRGGCKMMLNLSKHSQLKYVTLLIINHLDESSLLLSRDMLNIERVELSEIEISGECLQNMVKNMETISHLVTVKMIDIKPETEYERFRNYIRSSQTFDVTRDGGGFEFQTRKPSKE